MEKAHYARAIHYIDPCPLLRFLKQRIWTKLSNICKGKLFVTSLIFENIKEDGHTSANELRSAEHLLDRMEQ